MALERNLLVPGIHVSHLAYSSVLTQEFTHKFSIYIAEARLSKRSVYRWVIIPAEDREKIASSTRSNERRQAPGPSVNFKEETYTNGDLRNEDQKT